MQLPEMAQRMVNNLHRVVDDARSLGEYHIHPKQAARLMRIAERAMSLADTIEEEYDL